MSSYSIIESQLSFTSSKINSSRSSQKMNSDYSQRISKLPKNSKTFAYFNKTSILTIISTVALCTIVATPVSAFPRPEGNSRIDEVEKMRMFFDQFLSNSNSKTFGRENLSSHNIGGGHLEAPNFSFEEANSNLVSFLKNFDYVFLFIKFNSILYNNQYSICLAI